MPRRPGLWAEIGLNLALLTVAVSLLGVVVFYVANRVALSSAATDITEHGATLLAAQLSATPEADWKAMVTGPRRSESTEIAVYGTGGRAVAGTSSAAQAEIQQVFVTREPTTHVSNGEIRVLAPIGGPGRPAGVLALTMRPGGLGRPAWVVAGVHAGVSGAIIVGWGLFLLRRSVLAPLAAMRDTTQRIAAGAFGTQVSTDAPAELAELAGALNTMSAALSEYRGRTAEQLARLELANAELRQAQDALMRSERLASVGRLAAGLAHELGNPLAAVRGYVEILSSDPGPDSEARELVGRCQVEVERMHGLLRNLLDFARNDTPRVAPVRLDEVVEEAVRTVRHQPRFRTIHLEVESHGAVTIPGETEKLHQVLVNLLLNAADAQATVIRLWVRSDLHGVEVGCEDDGAGIPEAVQGRVFEPFFTTRPPGAGTGLGLAIAHRVMEQHGGRIEMNSEEGRGTTFRLRWDAPPPEPG